MNNTHLYEQLRRIQAALELPRLSAAERQRLNGLYRIQGPDPDVVDRHLVLAHYHGVAAGLLEILIAEIEDK